MISSRETACDKSLRKLVGRRQLTLYVLLSVVQNSATQAEFYES